MICGENCSGDTIVGTGRKHDDDGVVMVDEVMEGVGLKPVSATRRPPEDFECQMFEIEDKPCFVKHVCKDNPVTDRDPVERTAQAGPPPFPVLHSRVSIAEMGFVWGEHGLRGRLFTRQEAQRRRGI